MSEERTPGALGSNDGLGLVERLRQMSRRGHWPLLGDEAADEIERAWAARDAAVADLEAHAEAEVRRAVAAERERCALTDDQIAALTIMLDHYQGDPRTECLRPLVYGPNVGANLRAEGPSS